MITCHEVQLECSHFLTSLFYDRAKDIPQTSSKARSTIRFIAPPGATGNSAPLQACGAPVSGVRFVVGALPRCASALSAECLLPVFCTILNCRSSPHCVLKCFCLCNYVVQCADVEEGLLRIFIHFAAYDCAESLDGIRERYVYARKSCELLSYVCRL